MRIENSQIDPLQPAFIIAEIGVNHDGSVERAIELVHHAAAAGASAVKIQIFRAENLLHASATFAEYQATRVSETEPAAMLGRLELEPNAIAAIVREIRASNLVPIATPFSPADVDVIDELGLPAIKIASPDLVNWMLLDRVAKLNRPMLVSTGASTIAEIRATVNRLNDRHARFALLHCVSNYPTPIEQANLCWIDELTQFADVVGYSDHCTEIVAGAMAVARGAMIIEKHLTYDRAAAGPDHSASADPRQFTEYVRLIRIAEKLRGKSGKHVLDCERDVRNVSRQSLVFARDVSAGRRIVADDLTVKRPGTGVVPSELNNVIGRIANKTFCAGTMLQWEMLSHAA